MGQSIAFKNVDCTIEGGHLNLGAAFIESAEKSVAPTRHEVALVGRGRQLRFVIYFSLQRSGAEVEGISGREAQFDYAAVVLQRVGSVGQKLAGEKNVAGGGLRPDVIGAQIEQAEIAADGGGFNASGAAHAGKRTTDGLDGEVAGGVLEVHAGSDGFDVHIAEYVRDADTSGVIVNL